MIKINMLLLNVLYLILQVASGSQHEIIETLMPNVLVLKVDLDVFFETNVPLSCGEAHQDTDVTWRKNGSPVGSGNQITVKVEEMLAGNYSCHNQNGDYLNHTLVLVQDNQSHNRKRRILKEYNENDKNEYIRCLARNYSGMFHCSWKKSLHRNSASVVLVQAARFSGSNVSCYVDANSAGLTCEDTESCPYSEEVSHINLTVYFRTNFLLEEYTTTPFLIREIVRPDTVDFIKSKQWTLGKTVTLTRRRLWRRTPPKTQNTLSFAMNTNTVSASVPKMNWLNPPGANGPIMRLMKNIEGKRPKHH
ncbi:hypothetical protein DPEC_G00227260 [Dallia pectoralis]|uniref:Uncharacterized protein n=1 Tax=Dallia pectoralis TaxID=75939 RepID=A0ACC2G103_DALPE|nr:hypothetical protein DPEC_G00227260 [Dallia pectoralis]